MTKTILTPPTIDQATIDMYVARGRRERSHAFARMIRGIFRSPETRPESRTRRSDCTA